MTVVLYDLAGKDDRRFSPNCWRSRLAIAHKGLQCETRPTRFVDIRTIGGGTCPTVPALDDGGRLITDSWAIAEHLEATYPEAPSLFHGSGGRALTRFVHNWCMSVLHPGVLSLILADIHDHLQPEDRVYFRTSREQRFGRTLEEVQAGRETRVEAFRNTLEPVRSLVGEQSFIGGDRPVYADYLVFAPFQWARSVSPFRLVEADDPLREWIERCLDLFGGLARSVPAYD